PSAVFHNRTLLSSLPDTRNEPSVEKASDLTVALWPLSSLLSLPVSRFHRRMLLLAPPVARNWPSGEKAMAQTQCSGRVRSSSPVSAFHSRTGSLRPPEAMVLPSGE